MKKNKELLFALGFCVVALSGCAHFQAATPIKETSGNTIVIFKEGRISPVSPQALSVRKGQVTIAVEAQAASSKRDMCRKEKPFEYPPDDVGIQCRNCFWRTEYPCYSPGNGLYFNLKIKTDLSAPLHLEDTVVAFRIGDTSQPYEEYKESYDMLRKQVILPGAMQDLALRLPFKFSGMKPGETRRVVLGIYDLPVELDSASKPLKRGQFEYVFDVSYIEEERSEPQNTIAMERVKYEYFNCVKNGSVLCQNNPKSRYLTCDCETPGGKWRYSHTVVEEEPRYVK